MNPNNSGYFTVKDEWYSNGEILGRGSFATVYKGYRIVNDPKGEKPSEVAIKVVDISRLTNNNQKLLTHIETEVKIMEKLKHENIIELFDTETKKQRISNITMLYMILELCNGGDLAAYIKENKPLTSEEALHFSRDIAQGLKYVRSMNIVHRDLKPQNLLLHYKNKTLKTKNKDSFLPTIKIADFGFARFTLDQFAMVQTICGSPLYMAPEVLKAEIYNAKADLWSIGVIIYELLVGTPPFQANSIPQLLKMISNTTTTVEFPFTMEINSQAQDLVIKLLRSDPNLRIGYDEFFNHPWLNLNENYGSLSSASSTQSWVEESPFPSLRKSSIITKLNQGQIYDMCERFSNTASAIEYAGDYYLTQSHIKAAAIYAKSLSLLHHGLKIVSSISGSKTTRSSPKPIGNLNGVSFHFFGKQPELEQISNSPSNPSQFKIEFSKAFNDPIQLKFSLHQGEHEVIEALQENPSGILKPGNRVFVFENIRFDKMKSITLKNALLPNSHFRFCVEALHSSSSTSIQLYSDAFTLLSRHGIKIVKRLQDSYQRIYSKLLSLKTSIRNEEVVSSPEFLLYQFVLKQGIEAGTFEKVYGNYLKSEPFYSRSITILEQLLIDSHDSEDTENLSKLIQYFSQRKQFCQTKIKSDKEKNDNNNLPEKDPNNNKN